MRPSGNDVNVINSSFAPTGRIVGYPPINTIYLNFIDDKLTHQMFNMKTYLIFELRLNCVVCVVGCQATIF